MSIQRSLRLFLFVEIIVRLSWPSCGYTSEITFPVSTLTPELVQLVAKIGRPLTIKAKAGTDIFVLISENCGSANVRRFYLPFFIAANSENTDIKSGKTILTEDASLQLPACLNLGDDGFAKVTVTKSGPNWSNPVAISSDSLRQWKGPENNSNLIPNTPGVTVLNPLPENSKLPGQLVDFSRLTAGVSLPTVLTNVGPALVKQVTSLRLDDPILSEQYKKLVKQTISYVSAAKGNFSATFVPMADAFERSLRTQDILASNRSFDDTRLPKGAEIVSSVPPETQGSVQVAFAVPSEADVKAYVGQVQAVLPAETPISGLSNFNGNFAEGVEDIQDTGCSRRPDQSWPYDLTELQKVFELRSVLPEEKPRNSRTLIFDTGFPQGQLDTAPFNRQYFVQKPIDLKDDDEKYLWTTVHSIYFNPGAQYATHGVEVTTLALGGVDVLQSNMLTKYVTPDKGYVVSMMGYVNNGTSLEVNEKAVGDTLSGFNWGQTGIQGINLSFTFNEYYSGADLSSTILRHPEILYVFAAGNNDGFQNSNQNIDSTNLKPAIWGGKNSPNAITVGAINPDGSYFARSNFSNLHVDVAAPGCAVPSYSWNSQNSKFERVWLSGTSVAAPLVSFIGNILRNDLIGATRIKSRILASGHYYPSLGSKVSSSRAIDIPNALAVDIDTIRDRSGHLRLGVINWPSAGKSVCSRPRKRGDIFQIHITDNAENINIAIKTDNYGVNFIACPLEPGQLKDILFQEAKIVDGVATLAFPESLDIRSLSSITFCDACTSYDKWYQ